MPGLETNCMTVQPRMASAVMLLRDLPAGRGGQDKGIEVFMVRRVIQSDFMPNVYVFPCGSVSKDDYATELADGVSAPVAASVSDPEGRTAAGKGVRAAAIRELFEEAGMLPAYRDGEILPIPEDQVAHFDSYRRAFQQRHGSLEGMARAERLLLATDRLGYFAHWITPEGMPKRFDTHFFITTAPAEQEAAHDRLETSEGVWITPAAALARSEQGTFPLVFATIRQLRDLSTFGTVKEALESTTTRHVVTHIPLLVRENGVTRVYLPEDAGNPWD